MTVRLFQKAIKLAWFGGFIFISTLDHFEICGYKERNAFFKCYYCLAALEAGMNIQNIIEGFY